MSIKISVDKCSRHGFVALMIGDEASGKRLTRGKCCGSWDKTLHSWSVDADDLREIAEELTYWAERLESHCPFCDRSPCARLDECSSYAAFCSGARSTSPTTPPLPPEETANNDS